MSQNGLYWYREAVANDLIKKYRDSQFKSLQNFKNNSLQKIAFNEKESKKEYIYSFLDSLNHFAVHLKNNIINQLYFNFLKSLSNNFRTTII